MARGHGIGDGSSLLAWKTITGILQYPGIRVSRYGGDVSGLQPTGFEASIGGILVESHSNI